MHTELQRLRSVESDNPRKAIYRIRPELHTLEESQRDIQELVRIHNDPRVLNRLAGTEQTTDDLLKRARDELTKVFVFRGLEDRRVVGMVNVIDAPYLSVAQTSITGLAVDPELWGRGIATQGLVFTLDKLKSEPAPVRHDNELYWVPRQVIYTGTKADDTEEMTSTIHILESIGFENKGLSRNYLRDMSPESLEKMRRGEPVTTHDAYKFELYLEEWPNEKSRRILDEAYSW